MLKTSIPEKLVEKDEYLFFQTRMKFESESFSKFDKEVRISDEIFEVINKEVGMG